MELGLLFLFGLTITSTAGSALPRERDESGAAAAGGGLRPRARRCTCSTYKDKECVYYCHLDIIWINTPELSCFKPTGITIFIPVGKVFSVHSFSDVENFFLPGSFAQMSQKKEEKSREENRGFAAFLGGICWGGSGECSLVCEHTGTLEGCDVLSHNKETCVCNMCRRTVPYGLSNYRGSFRGKRATGQTQSASQPSLRCSCLDAQDEQCLQFCRRMQDRRRNHGAVKQTEEQDQCREEEHNFIQ